MTTRVRNPFQFGFASLFAIGMALFLFGAIPMIAALVVSNQVIDDGPHPADDFIIAEWDAWAFGPRFMVTALVGIGLIVTSSVVFWRSVRASEKAGL